MQNIGNSRASFIRVLTLCVCTLLLTAANVFAATGDSQEPPQVRLERTLIEQGGLLLPPGQMEIEPSLDYSHFSTRRIDVSGFSILPTLIIGVIETQRIQRDVFDPAITMRLGVIKDVQAELRIPFRWTHDRISTETTETTTEDGGLGDIEAAISVQPIKERGWVPDIILGLRGKSRTGRDPFGNGPNDIPTGTGLYSVTATVTAVKSSDPAAVFGSLIYTYNFDRTVQINRTDNFKTEIDPGATYGYNMGVALAISIDLSMNFRIEQRFTDRTTIRQRPPGTTRGRVNGSTINAAQAFIGLTWALTQNSTVDVSVGIGLTDDAPDVSVRFSVPIRFTAYDPKIFSATN